MWLPTTTRRGCADAYSRPVNPMLMVREAAGRLPVCDWTDIPRILCDHCRGRISHTPTEQAWLAYRRPPDPEPPPARVQHHRLDYTAPPHATGDWSRPVPKIVVCTHDHDPASYLCPLCADDFRAYIADVPGLVDDLDVTLTRQDQFLDQGIPDCNADQAVHLEWHEGAAQALAELRRILGPDPAAAATDAVLNWTDTLRRPDLQRFAYAVTDAVRRGHEAIERRETRFDYGPCPTCGTRILQERVPQGDPTAMIVCPKKDYAADLTSHQMTQVQAGQDRWQPVKEILRALHILGEPMARHELDNLIYRDGLPREKHVDHRWVDGQIRSTEQWMMRLRDVRALRRGGTGLVRVTTFRSVMWASHLSPATPGTVA